MGRVAKLLHLNARGAVRVELERTALLPGDEIVGVVHVRVTKPIPSAQLHVRIRGTQRLRWLTHMDEVHVPQWRKLVHLDHTITLVGHDAMFLPGDLQYPFAFQLPKQDLPPSVQFKRCHVDDLEAVRAAVDYAVEAALVVDAFTVADATASTAFTVKQPMARSVDDGEPVAAQQQDAPVKVLGLFKSGLCSVSVELPSDVLSGGSTVEAHASLAFHTPQRLKYVKLALHQDATIDRHGKRFQKRLKHGSRAVSSRRFDPTALGLGVSPDAAVGSQTKASLQLPLTPLDKPKCDALVATLSSHYLTVQYHVRVECHFAMARTVRVCVPVTVVGE